MKKVAILIEPAREWSQGLLRGIVKYVRIHSQWDFRVSAFYGAPLFSPFLKKTEIAEIKDWHAEGVITRHIENIEVLLDMNIPIIYAGDDKIVPGVPNILTNHKEVSRLAAKHLLGCNFKHFAFCGFSDCKWSNDRCEFFNEVIGNAGYECNNYNHPISSVKKLWRNEVDLLAKWIETLPKPVGIMTCSDFRSLHVLDACRMTGFNIPEDVAIIGADNDEIICEYSSTPLSSVAINTEKVGYESAKLLDKLMNSGQSSEEIIYANPTYIISRQSTDIVNIEDIEVSKAVLFIRQNSRRNLQVNEVVDVTNISRRGLEQRFRKVLMCSIHAAIRKYNVAHISKFLVETNMPINQLALNFGHPTVGNLSRYFKQETGMSPSEYRKKHTL